MVGFDGDLSGKKVLVTGGSSGIGEQLVRQALSAGATVRFTYRTNTAKQTDFFREFGERALSNNLDLGNVSGTRELLEIWQSRGPFDYAILNAGREFSGNLARHDWETIRGVIEADLTGNLYLLKGLVTGEIMAEGGQISVIGSIAADGNHDQFAYSAAKAGLRGAVESLSRYDGDVKAHRLGVKLLEPAFVRGTGMTARLLPILERRVIKPELLDEFRKAAVMDADYAAAQILHYTVTPWITGVRTIPEETDLHAVRGKYFKSQ